jgi:hypothetical protein
MRDYPGNGGDGSEIHFICTTANTLGFALWPPPFVMPPLEPVRNGFVPPRPLPPAETQRSPEPRSKPARKFRVPD